RVCRRAIGGLSRLFRPALLCAGVAARAVRRLGRAVRGVRGFLGPALFRLTAIRGRAVGLARALLRAALLGRGGVGRGGTVGALLFGLGALGIDRIAGSLRGIVRFGLLLGFLGGRTVRLIRGSGLLRLRSDAATNQQPRRE